jgi:hypothetical protein
VAVARRTSLPQPQVAQYLLADRRVLHHGHQPQLAPALGAQQNLFPPYPAEKLGPRQTASAPRVVWADQPRVGCVVMLVLVWINRLLVLGWINRLRINSVIGSACSSC